MRDPEDLPLRLRRETADLHAEVEAATGLPGSVRSRSGYIRLLHRLHGFHQAAERILADPRWTPQWAELHIDLSRHRRAHLLERDLGAMGAESSATIAPPPWEIGDFAGALGCLYVVEGSSLGGRVIGPAIRSAIGEVPTGFFESAERDHPSPWRSLKDALRRYDGDGDAVVAGARTTFRAFDQRVAEPSASTQAASTRAVT